jgi:CheY-like chemotaxis protein
MGVGTEVHSKRTIKRGTHETRFELNNSLKILIAEDNEINLAVTTKTLELIGYNSEKAFTGKEVLEKLKKSDYDLILMDIHMPEMDSMEATRRIKSMFASSSAPVIIGLSTSSKDEVKEFLEKGMDDFLPKPLDAELLNEKINYWFPSRDA